MRNAVGIFGAVCGIVIIGLVGRYGFKTTDVEFDAWIMAFFFGVIATAGLAGHAVAVRVWPYNKAVALAVGIVSCAALVLNLSNSLGAIAGRQDQAEHERVAKNRGIRAAEAEIKRLTDLRDAMPAFVPTDADAVAAADRAAKAATTSKERECGGGNPKERGRNCRDREADEAAAMKTLGAASAAKAQTDRAAKLEADAEVQRRKLSELGPIVSLNVQGGALAKLFRLPDGEAEFAAMVQQFGLAAIAELIIVLCLVCWEVLRRSPSRGGRDRASVPDPILPTQRNREPPIPTRLPPAPKPKLIASNPDRPVGSVKRILTDHLESAHRDRVEFAEISQRYLDVCRQEGLRPVPQDEFIDAVDTFFRDVGIKRRASGSMVYFCDVALVPVASAASAQSAR